jgi:L-ascorbate metabolism protein UlaG (beta-lactamase superfamily)
VKIKRTLLYSFTFITLPITIGYFVSEYTPYYKGPISDHFTGTRFFNPNNTQKFPFLSFFKWMLSNNKKQWPTWIKNHNSYIPPKSIKDNNLRVTFINHATILLQIKGLTILTDPMWADRVSPVTWIGPKRIHAPGIPLEKLPKIDVILISHDHYDHLDMPTLSKLYYRDKPRIFVGLGVDTVIHGYDASISAESMDWGDQKTIKDGITIHFVPAQHWSGRGIFDRNKTLWGSFVIQTKNGNIYFSGDTRYDGGDHFRQTAQKFAPFRLALLPIGNYKPYHMMKHAHMTPHQSIKAHKDLKAKLSLGIHFGTFQLSDESHDDPPQELARMAKKNGLTAHEFRVLNVGQSLTIPL